MEYQVASAEVLNVLEREVRELIEDGWEPLGGIAVKSVLRALSQDRFPNSQRARTAEWFYQAMVRKEGQHG